MYSKGIFPAEPDLKNKINVPYKTYTVSGTYYLETEPVQKDGYINLITQLTSTGNTIWFWISMIKNDSDIAIFSNDFNAQSALFFPIWKGWNLKIAASVSFKTDGCKCIFFPLN